MEAKNRNQPRDASPGAAPDTATPNASVTATTIIPTTNKPIRSKIKNFSLSWFSVCMGTGIVSTLLFTMPYRGPGQRTTAIVFFVANLFLFVLFVLVTATRYYMFPQIPRLLLSHPTESLYLGAVPMAWATIVNMAVYTSLDLSSNMVTIAWIGWWADVVMSLVTCFVVTYAMISRHVHGSISETSSLWLLPIVSAPVASTSAAIIIPHLQLEDAYVTLLVGYAMWGFGILLASMILMIYLQRLIFHHLPPKQLIVSIWLPIGYMGQGVYSIVKLGKQAQILFPQLAISEKHATSSMLSSGGDTLYFAGSLFALLLWGFSMWWLLIAIFAVLDHLRTGFPFSMGWWSFTFPLGSLAAGTVALGEAFDAPFFLVLGEIMSWAVIALYCLVLGFTLRQAYRGTLFQNTPCMEKAPEDLRNL